MLFTEFDWFLDWASSWRIYLANNHRLMVMTNLDAGMSMEINPPGTDAKMFNLIRVVGQRAQRRGETLRLLDEWWMDNATFEADQHRAYCD
ncbi:MAG: hypothetical protein OSB69_16620, partial [Alphaproteobacteria bacterium]|nr:hypothetical protein [Alphaproteobacteria bacterium]